MHALIPLLFTLILFNSKQLKNDKLYRANIFALVGISYFCVLQYALYWYRVFPTESVAQYLPGLLAVSSAIGIALSPWNRRSHPLKTVLLCGLFGFSLLSTFAFDKAIKETLAEIGGFFQNDVSLKPDKASLSDHKLVELQSIGIQLQIPQHWQQRQLSSGHHYFIYDEQGKVLLEVRPNCLDALEIDTPTYLSNILQLFEGHNAGAQYESRCAQMEADKNCLVQVRYPQSGSIKEKWHWLEIPTDQSRTFALDFVLLEDLSALKVEVWDVISSVAILKDKATEPCRTPAAWL